MIVLTREQLLFIACQLVSGRGSIKGWAHHYNFKEGVPAGYAEKQIRDYIEEVRE